MKIVHDVFCSSCGAKCCDALIVDESAFTEKPLCSACIRDIIHRFLEFTGIKPSDFDLG